MCQLRKQSVNKKKKKATYLLSDGQNVMSVLERMSSEQRNNFNERIHQDYAHSCSDLLDATTQGRVSGSYGHSRDYWSTDGNLQAEAFAHFFEASMGGGRKLELLSSLFPNSFAIFSDMIDSLRPTEHVLIRRR